MNNVKKAFFSGAVILATTFGALGASDAEGVTADTTAFEAGKTYLVTNDVTVAARITVKGTTATPSQLILCAGATLTAERGIDVAPGKALGISARGEGAEMGALVATGGPDEAGVGSGCYMNAGTISISGGRVTATGGSQGAGIGGGAYGGGGDIMIAGGIVTATGKNGAAGIGGAGGRITITGGVVEATGSDNAAGIGAGNGRNCGTVTISGGIVTARGGDGGAGIGGGASPFGGDGGAITITKGTVTATGGKGAADIGSGEYGPATAVTIGGGSVLATRSEIRGAPKNASGEVVHCVTVEGLMPDEFVSVGRLKAYYGYETAGIYADAAGKIGLWLPNGNYGFSAGGENHVVFVNGANTTAVRGTQTGVTVNGVEAAVGSGKGWRYDSATHVVELTNDGSYVLSGANADGRVGVEVGCNAEVTLSSLSLKCNTRNASCLRVADGSTVTLYLAGTNTLDACKDVKTDMGEGLSLGNGARLTITNAAGFADGDAVLIAKGSVMRAAIALGRTGTEGEKPRLEIAGGTVLANWFDEPAYYSVGIGTSSGTDRVGEADIVISGGRVFARGGIQASGIGAEGHVDACGPDVRITGGYVEAMGGTYAAGIGGGLTSQHGSVTVSGGTVRATGDGTASDMLAGENDQGGGAFRVTGGSIVLTRLDAVLPSPAPTNAAGEAVHSVAVDVPSSRASGLSPCVISGLGDYGTDGIAPVDGKICLWLPNGRHRFSVDGVEYVADVQDGPTTARPCKDVGVTVNGVDVEIGAGEGWAYADGLLTLSGAGPFVVSGTNTAGRVAVVQSAASTVTISNLMLSTTGRLAPYAVTCATGAKLLLAGVNKLSAQLAAAVEVNSGAALAIDGAGGATDEFLVAVGGEGSAAIGGGSQKVHGRIEICGGTIDAKGGFYGAAVGSGGYAYGTIAAEDQIVISGGFVTASAGSGGAAIGGGYDSVFGPVTVSGGTVDAGGSESRKNDIGNGWNRDGRAVTITGGSVLARAAKINLPPTDGASFVHRVTVNLGLGNSGSGTVALEGLGGYGTNDVVAINNMVYLYLPDGDYQFKVNGDDYCACVAGGATDAEARRGFLPTGVTVNGDDLSTLSGTGWTWNRMTCELACDAGDYILSGANTDLTVNATLADGATVIASNLVLAAFSGSLTVGGTTVDLGSLDGLLTVTGGSVRVGGETVASNLTERVWCVTVEGLEGLVCLEGLESYGTNEIAAIDGKVYLWLPNGRHAFEANGVRYSANVADGPANAAALVGFAVNGEDVVAGRGLGWELADGLLTLDGTATNAFELVGELTADLGVNVACGEGRDAVAIRVSGSVLAVTNGLTFALAPKTGVRTVDEYVFAVKADGSLALGKGRYHFNPEGLYDAETLAAVLVTDETWQIIDRPDDTGIRVNGLDIGGVEWTADGSACHFNTNDWALSFNQGLPFSLEGTNLTGRPIALSLAPDGLSVTFTNLVVAAGADAGFTIAAGCDPAYWGFFTNAANTVLAGEGVYAFDPVGRTMAGLTSGRIGADRWRVVPSGSFKARATVDDVTYSCLTLAEALAFASEGGRIELDANIEGEPLLVPFGSSFTLIGNGHVIAPLPATAADALVSVASNCLIAVTNVVFDGCGIVSNALAAVESFGALALADCTVRGFCVPEGALIEVDSSLGSAVPALTLSNFTTADNAALGAVGAAAGTSILAVTAPEGELEDVVVLAENAAIAFTNAAPTARLVLNPLNAANRVGETLVRPIAGGVALDPAKVRICAAGYSAVGDGQGGIVFESVTSRPFAVGADAAFAAYRTFDEAIAAADGGRVASVYYENVPEGVALVTNVQDITVGAGTNAVIGTVYRMTPDGTNTVWTFPSDRTAVLAGRIRVKGSLALENVEVVSPLVLDGGVVAVGADYDLGGEPTEITFANPSALAEGALVVTSSVHAAAQLLDAFCVRMPGYVLTAEAGGLAVRTLANSFVAKIDDGFFHSLAAAVAAAKDGETVEAITLTNLTRQTVRDTVIAEGTCAIGSDRRVVLGSAVCALDEFGRFSPLVESNAQTTVKWPAGSRLEIGADAVLVPSNVVFTETLTLAGEGLLDLAAYDADEIAVKPQRLGKVAANASGKLRLADGTDGELAILANGDAIYRRGAFSARFVETGNGVGRICIDDYGAYSEVACDEPITTGSVSHRYVNAATGVDTNLMFGVTYLKARDNAVVLPSVDRTNVDPRYLAKDGTRKILGQYVPTDAKLEGATGDQSVTLYNYGCEFKVGGLNFYADADQPEERERQIEFAIKTVEESGGSSSFFDIFKKLGDKFKDVAKRAVELIILAVDETIGKAIITIDKIIETVKGLVSLIHRASSDLYVGAGRDDDDYYKAEEAAKAFNRMRNDKSAVHFMRDVRTPPYLLDGSNSLNIDMAGAPRLDVSFVGVWASWAIDDLNPVLQELVDQIVSEIAQLGIQGLEELIYMAAEDSFPHHTSAASSDDAWLTVKNGASITLMNFKENGWTLSSPLAGVQDGGRLTVESSEITGFTTEANGMVCVYGTGHVTFSGSRVTGNRKSSGSWANVCVETSSNLSVEDGGCRIGVSGRTEGGEAFAQTGGKNFDWASIYSNDAHAGDSTYEIEVNAKNELCWKWNAPDPDAPSFPEPGDESIAGGRAVDIRMITKEVEPGVVMSYARIWGAPTNGVKGAWYYLKATEDLGGEFLYLPGFKWRAGANGAVEVMQKGPEGSCCDVPAPGSVTNRFFRFAAQKVEP